MVPNGRGFTNVTSSCKPPIDTTQLLWPYQQHVWC